MAKKPQQYHVTLWQLQVWIARTKSFWEFCNQVAEDVIPDTQRRSLLKKLAQRIRQKLILEMLQLHDCVEDIRSTVEHKIGQFSAFGSIQIFF